jgi:hypothetical protein
LNTTLTVRMAWHCQPGPLRKVRVPLRDRFFFDPDWRWAAFCQRCGREDNGELRDCPSYKGTR